MKNLKNRFLNGVKKIRNTREQTKTVVLQPTVLVLATYVLMLLSRLIDFAFINRENEYFSIVILQMMIFLLPGALWCKFSGEKLLGVDPVSGKNVFVKIGRFGPVAQIGDTDSEEKPKFAGLKKDQSIETITLTELLKAKLNINIKNVPKNFNAKLSKYGI